MEDHLITVQMMEMMTKMKMMDKKERNQLIKINHQIPDHQNMEAAQMMIHNQLNLKNKMKDLMMDLSGQLILKKVHNHLLDQPDHEIRK